MTIAQQLSIEGMLAGERPLAAGLTAEQQEAVAMRDGSLLLAAGAGSGKTAVIVERFASAVALDGIAPGRILAITFTERAAWELKQRLRRRLRELGMRAQAVEAESAVISTFHGFCAQLLASESLAAGVAPGFSILEQTSAARLCGSAFTEALAGLLAEDASAEALDVLAAYGVERLRKMIFSCYGELRSRGLEHPTLPVPPPSSELQVLKACDVLRALLERFGLAYEQGKRRRGALDFDDLELRALALLRSRPDVRIRCSERFDLLMVDEFQDTNPRQLALLEALQRENLFTVGDEWQAIYGFRHADVEIFRARADSLRRRGAMLALTLNFRSTPAVIEAVNRVFCKRFGERYTRLCAADAAPGDRVELLLTDKDGWEEDEELGREIAAGLPTTSLWRQAEARLLAQRIAQLIADGQAQAGEIAVLLRSAKDLAVYERAIAAHGVPTLAAAGGFWVDAQVADLLCYLRALANPHDEAALLGTLASPLVGLSMDALASISRAARRSHDRGELWRVASGDCRQWLPEGDADALTRFAAGLARRRQRLRADSLAVLLREAIEDSGYGEQLLRLEDGERRLANVRKLVRLAANFEASEGRDLRAFLDHVAELAQSASHSEPDAPTGDGEREAVALMTIHASKGLEFPVVCVADLGRLPVRSEAPDLLVEGDSIGLRLLRLGQDAPALTLDYDSLRERRACREAEEEQRIIYVAMTRAKRRLLLSGAARFRRWPADGNDATPIVWLASELLDDVPGLLEGGMDELRAPAGTCCLLNRPSNVGAVLSRAAPIPHEAERASHAGDRVMRKAAGAGGGVAPAAAGPEPAAPRVAPVAPGPEPAAAGPEPAAPRVAPVAPGPEPPPQPSARALSYTAIAELERCGYRHYLERILGLPESSAAAEASRRPDHGLDARRRGEVAHLLLERVDFAKRRPPEAAEAVEAARELGVRLSTADANRIATALRGLHQSPLAARLGACRSSRREQAFAFSLSLPASASARAGGRTQLIVGSFDLIAEEEPGSVLIVDYKSGPLGLEQPIEQLAATRFELQRTVYALAALRDGAASVEVVHWFLARPLEPASACYRRTDAAKLEGDLCARIERIDRRGYAASEHPHRGLCLRCPGRARLCPWDEQHTLREVP